MPDIPDTEIHPLEVERPHYRAPLARFMFRCWRCGLEVPSHRRACATCTKHYQRQAARG